MRVNVNMKNSKEFHKLQVFLFIAVQCSPGTDASESSVLQRGPNKPTALCRLWVQLGD